MLRLVLSNSIHHTPVTADDVHLQTANDNVLGKAIKLVKSKWPTCLPEGELLDLNRRRSSSSVVDSSLLLANRVVIPSKLRQRVLRQFHSSHLGIGGMKSIA